MVFRTSVWKKLSPKYGSTMAIQNTQAKMVRLRYSRFIGLRPVTSVT